MAARSMVMLALVAAGCGGSGSATDAGLDRVDPNGVVSCTVSQSDGTTTAMVICYEGSGTLRGPLQLQCMGPPDAGGPGTGVTNIGHFVEAPCSHVGAVGGCASTVLGMTQTGWYYAAGGFTAPQVQQLCAGIGATYVAP